VVERQLTGEEVRLQTRSGRMVKTCVDLFSGLGGFSRAFRESEEWEVIEVDIQEKFEPDICENVMSLRREDLPECELILASPPCTEFSFAASSLEKIVDGKPQTPEAKDAVHLVYYTLGLIKAVNPEYWFLENPRGWLRQIIGDPDGFVTYCQYGAEYMKPTDLWGVHPPSFEYESCNTGDSCHVYNTSQSEGGDGNMTSIDEYSNDSAERAKVPYGLSKSILESVENPSKGVQSASEVSW